MSNLPTIQDPSCFCSDKDRPKDELREECLGIFPDVKNPNELPRICPVHGEYTLWQKLALIDAPPPKPKCKCRSLINDASRITTNSPYDIFADRTPSYYRITCSPWQPGNVCDLKENKLKAFQGNSVSNCPKPPCIVDSHTHRAKYLYEKKLPYINFHTIGLGSIFRYLKAMGLTKEIAKLAWHSKVDKYPHYIGGYGDRVNDEVHVSSSNAIDFLFIKFENEASYVLNVNRTKFKTPPNVFFGDCLVSAMFSQIPGKDKASHHQNMFKLIIQRNPFLKWHTLRLRSCSIIKNCDGCCTNKPPVSLLEDIGIILIDGEIRDVMDHSPAQECNLKPGTHIVEVGSRTTITMTDVDIADYIRHYINTSPDRLVRLATVPSIIFQRLTQTRTSKLYYLTPTMRSATGAWDIARPFLEL